MPLTCGTHNPAAVHHPLGQDLRVGVICHRVIRPGVVELTQARPPVYPVSAPRAHPRRTLTRGYGASTPLADPTQSERHHHDARVFTVSVLGRWDTTRWTCRTVGVEHVFPLLYRHPPVRVGVVQAPPVDNPLGRSSPLLPPTQARLFTPRASVVTGEDLVTAGRPLKGAIQRAHERRLATLDTLLRSVQALRCAV